jgi:hypothetical protein
VCVHAWWNFLPVRYEYVYDIALPYLYPTDIIFSYFCSKLQHDSYILLHANRDFVTNGIIFAILECVQNVTTFFSTASKFLQIHRQIMGKLNFVS